MMARPHDDVMVELLRDDPVVAAELLNSVLADGDQAELMVTLRQLAKAFGGVRHVAVEAHLNPTQLYRALSEPGNPKLSSLRAILGVMGLRLAVQPIERTKT